MKKILFLFAVLASLVACSKDDIIDSNRREISFGGPFVQNSTKAIDDSYSGKKSLTTFNVWGTVTGNNKTVNVFNGATCSGNINMDIWGCDQTEYWVPNCTYNFTAIVDADANGIKTGNYTMPTEITVTSDGTKDLLLATATATTNNNAEPSQNPVKFSFTHLMSQAYFTFQNTVGNDNYQFQVTGIKVSNLYSKGTYTIGADTPWAVSDVSRTSVDFGSAVYAEGEETISDKNPATSNYARTFLPATYGESNKFNVSFKAYLIYKGETIGVKDYSYDVAHTFAVNGCYNFVVSLGAGNKITFKVNEVLGWGEIPDINIP